MNNVRGDIIHGGTFFTPTPVRFSQAQTGLRGPLFTPVLIFRDTPRSAILIFVYTAPSAAPTSVSVSVVNSTAITIQWEMVPCIYHNGVITSYSFSCSPSPSSLPQSSSQSGPLIVAGFSPNTFYSCSVVATNSHGSGPPANITFTTQQDCKLISPLLKQFFM